MSRFVTVATYDQLYLAEMTRESLEEAGVRVFLSDVEVVGNLRNLGAAGGGVKVQVAEENAERAIALLREIDFTREIDEEELAREALAAPTEDEWIAAQSVRRDSGSDPESPSPASDRDKQASKALWWMVGGCFSPPRGPSAYSTCCRRRSGRVPCRRTAGSASKWQRRWGRS